MFIDKEEFDRNLMLTQAYCHQQMQLRNQIAVRALRTINPDVNGKPLFTYCNGDKDRGMWNCIDWTEDPLNNQVLYDDLFQLQLAYKEKAKPLIGRAYEGKILFAEIDQVIVDGVSEEESNGFIDYNDCPPIDTWFYMTANNNTRMLFAWIPQKFISLTQDAIDVNMLNCFNWFDEDEVNRRLTSYGNRAHLKTIVSPSQPSSGLMQFLRKIFGKD